MTEAGDLRNWTFAEIEEDGFAADIHGGISHQGVNRGDHLSPAGTNRPKGGWKKILVNIQFVKAFHWKVSSLSFGASSLGGVFKATDDSESATLVKRVVQQGINYIDTAPWSNNWYINILLLEHFLYFHNLSIDAGMDRADRNEC